MDRGKPDDDVYLPHAKALLASMKAEGFQPYWPIPVGRDGEILDGAHRTACAIALGIDALVQPVAKISWAPSWGRTWFRENEMPEADFDRLEADVARLMQKQSDLGQ